MVGQGKGIMKLRQAHILFLLLALYFAIKAAAVLGNSVPAQSDASLYIYTAKAVAEGAVPYRDFFFAHPLLMILPTVVLFRLFGPSFLAGALQPVMAGAGILALTFLAGEKMKRGAGLIAGILLLSSYYFQFGTHWMGGVALNSFLLMLSFYFMGTRRPFRSGFALLLSVLARYSSFPAVIVLVAYQVLRKRRRFFLGLLAALPALAALLLVPNFLSDTVLYHLAKGSAFGIGGRGALAFLEREAVLVGLGIASAVYFLRERRSEFHVLIFALAASPLLLVSLSEVYPWYLFYSLPFLSLAAGLLFAGLWGRIGFRPAIPLLIAVISIVAFAHTFDSISPPGGGLYESAYEYMPVGEGDAVFDTLSNMGAHFCLEKGCRIAGNVIDITPVRIGSGFADMEEIVSRVSSDSPRYIIDMRGGAGGDKKSWDHVWRQTVMRDYVYENFRPELLIYDGQSFLLTVIWTRKGEGTLQLEGGEGVYDYEYLSSYSIRGQSLELEYAEGQRLSETNDVFFSEGLSKHIMELNPDSLEVPASIWRDLSKREFSAGGYRVNTWVVPEKNLVFTELSTQEYTEAIIVMQYRPELGTWGSLTIYQNILGGFVPVYAETLAYTIAYPAQ